MFLSNRNQKFYITLSHHASIVSHALILISRNIQFFRLHCLKIDLSTIKMDGFEFRSPVISQNASVVCEQPLGSKIGYDILQKGGNAADAAIAMSVAVGFLSPYAAGLGGDCHILYYKASDRTVHSINGSGRSAISLTLQKVCEAGFSGKDCKDHFLLDKTIKDSTQGLFINVPGYVMGIHQLLDKFGSHKLKMEDLFNPTIAAAEAGAPISKKAVSKIQLAYHHIQKSKNVEDVLGTTKIPEPGHKIRAPKLAKCLKEIATEGPKAFYCEKIAERIVKCVQKAGGVLTMDDMKYHYDNADKLDTRENAIYIDFRGFRIWEMPPNTTGIIVLHALSLLETVDLYKLGHNSAEYIRTVSNAIREAVLFCWKFLCDPACLSDDFCKSVLNNQEYRGAKQAFKPPVDKVYKTSPGAFNPLSGDTSYVTAIDEQGNACSLIFSVYNTFGSANIPDDCGFVLQDRGKLFSLDEHSLNVIGSRKRSLHTILPAMITDPSSGELIASFGLIGGWMQPQGQIQVLLNMIIFGMDPQMALDQPRFLIGDPHLQTAFRDSLHILNLESGINSSVVSELKDTNQDVVRVTGTNRTIFGCGQIIAKPKLWSQDGENTLWAGTDSRADGIPIGY